MCQIHDVGQRNLVGRMLSELCLEKELCVCQIYDVGQRNLVGRMLSELGLEKELCVSNT